MKQILLTLLALLAGCFSGHTADYRVSSPSGNIILTVSNGDRLTYSVTWNGRTAIAPSALGFEFKGEKPMAGPFTVLGGPAVEAHVEAWKPVVANKYSEVSVASKNLTLQLKETADEGRRMDLEFRVMDDGVAFRYTLYPVTRVGDRMIQRELTEFAVPAGTEGWMTEYPRPFRSSQEAWRTRTPLSAVPDTQITGLPLLLKAENDLYLAITEAAMDNWSGFYLGVGKTDKGVCTLETHLSPLPWEEQESWANLKKYEEGVKVRFDDVIRSSWRLVMIADNPGKFIESEAIHSLNEPCAIEDPSWIKPGLSAWDHWWSGEVKVDMPTIKEYIDFASQMGWPYMLIDWQWYGPYAQPNADITKAAPQLDMPEILAYAEDRNVRCWLWIHSDDAARNNAFYDAFPLYRDWGVAGVKIDFMDREDQEMVRWYRRVIERAAECRLMVDFHGAYKPDGIDRTWPNMMTREGVLGSEYYKFAADRQLPTPEHNVTLAFTRMLAGQMDYTPGGFLNVRREDWKRQTPALVCDTRCAELAKFVIYDSPYMVFCDHPKHVLGQPGADFLQIVPTVWDDTRFLGGAPEEYVLLAKRSGDTWFVGCLNNSVKKKVAVDLSFLPAGIHTATVWMDGKKTAKDPKILEKKVLKVSPDKPLEITMESAGGFVLTVE